MLLFSDSKRGCNFTTRIDENRFSTYSQRFLSPYYYTSLQQNVICLHRIEGIPEKAYVAFSIFYGSYRPGHQYSYQNFTVSNGTDYEYIFSNRNPVYMRKVDGTNSLLLNSTGGRYYTDLSYTVTGNGRYDGHSKSHILDHLIDITWPANIVYPSFTELPSIIVRTWIGLVCKVICQNQAKSSEMYNFYNWESVCYRR